MNRKRNLTMGRRVITGAIAFLLLLGLGPLGIGGPGVVSAGSTGKISGKVTDAKTNEPLPSVNIVVSGTSMGASTDLQGDYFIANVPAGTYSLKASLVGYKPMTVTGVVVHVDATSEVKFSMEQTVLELNKEIVVTAQRPLVEKDNTASRTVMSSNDIINRPTTDLTNVLVTLPSINNDNGVLKVRGSTLDEVAVLVDGARARNPLDQTPFTNVNLSAIQEMEVITGSFNAEYGEAQSGVFNIITKEGTDQYHAYADVRYTPPAIRHWGTALYDYSSPLYWEDTHARHLQWWIQYPDQWVDPNGVYGNDPRCMWTPEQAYNNYMQTHQPLHDYTHTPSYQTEASFGGPIPELPGGYFFLSGKYRSEAPLVGNSFLDRGQFFDGSAKLTYNAGDGKKVILSGFLGTEKTSWGIDGPPDYFYESLYGLTSRYAYYDFPGLPHSTTDGQTLKFTNALDASTMYEVKVSRVHAYRQTDTLTGDPVGWLALGPTYDDLRAVDSAGHQVIGGYQNRIGYHTTGYYFRNNDNNTDWSLSGYYSRQFNKHWELKSGLEFTYYNLNHINQAKAPDRMDDHVYNPYQGAAYAQNKLEFGGLIMNAGLRYDFYSPNDVVYTNIFDPLNSASVKAPTFSQLSPRIGISHPIDEKTVLHFSYGHFFERGPFGDYGEGTSDDQARGSLTTFVIDGTSIPWVLGNRDLKPQKTVAYEVGLERNFFEDLLLTVTGYYKDITNTIEVVTVETPQGVYRTNGNGDYADVRGLETSLRLLPAPHDWGSMWGYANFTTQYGIDGKSGDPRVITPTGNQYATSGDFIVHNDPRLKAGFYYKTPHALGLAGGAFADIQISLDYSAVYPNDQLFSDFFLFNGQKYLRPADKNANLKVAKEFQLFGNQLKLSGYLEVDNLFNDKWINLGAFEVASPVEQQKFVDSKFEYLPSTDANGTPILDLAKYRNLPRSILFGLTMEL